MSRDEVVGRRRRCRGRASGMLADLEKGSMFPASRFEARQIFGGVASGGGGCAAGTLLREK